MTSGTLPSIQIMTYIKPYFRETMDWSFFSECFDFPCSWDTQSDRHNISGFKTVVDHCRERYNDIHDSSSIYLGLFGFWLVRKQKDETGSRSDNQNLSLVGYICQLSPWTFKVCLKSQLYLMRSRISRETDLWACLMGINLTEIRRPSHHDGGECEDHLLDLDPRQYKK